MFVLYYYFFNFRRGGTSEESENMFLREQGMAGNQDTIPYGLLGGWVGRWLDGWMGELVDGWVQEPLWLMVGWVVGWVGC